MKPYMLPIDGLLPRLRRMGERAGGRRVLRACAPRRSAGRRSAFTLIELLIVLAIIGLIAGLSAPALKGLGKVNARAAAERQVLDDLALARQLAIKNRTTVYFVMVPGNLLAESGGRRIFAKFREDLSPLISALTGPYAPVKEALLRSFTNAVKSQYAGYALIGRGAAGDQPGNRRFRYLTDWRQLPDGMIFPQVLFDPSPGARQLLPTPLPNWISRSTNWVRLPFPTWIEHPTDSVRERQYQIHLPAIAFSPTGVVQLGGDPPLNRIGSIPPTDVYLALSEGSVFGSPAKNGQVDLNAAPDVVEAPKDNLTNSIIRISALTGRAKIVKPQFPDSQLANAAGN